MFVLSFRGKPLNPELVEAASAVASSLPLSKKQTESELLAQLRLHEETTDKQKKGGIINIRSVYWMLFSIMFEILILQCHLEGDWVLCWKDGPKGCIWRVMGTSLVWLYQTPWVCHPHSKMVLQKWNCFPAQDDYFLGQAGKITFFFFSELP